MAITTDLLRFVPSNATHCIVEERNHRGSTVYAVIAVVPNGAAIPLNGYSSQDLAESTAQEINTHLAA